MLRETRERKRKWIEKSDQGLPRLKQTGVFWRIKEKAKGRDVEDWKN